MIEAQSFAEFIKEQWCDRGILTSGLMQEYMRLAYDHGWEKVRASIVRGKELNKRSLVFVIEDIGGWKKGSCGSLIHEDDYGDHLAACEKCRIISLAKVRSIKKALYQEMGWNKKEIANG